MFGFKFRGIDFAHKLSDGPSPCDELKMHMHEGYEILYFVRGNIRYTIEGKSKKLMPGELLFISPGMLHTGVVDLDTPYERYVLKFNETHISPVILERISGCASFCGRIEGVHRFINVLDDIYENYDDEERYLMMTGILTRLMIQIYKLNPYAPSEQIYKNEVISKIVNYINDNVKSHLTLNSLCTDLHFSSSYICNEFSKEMHTPVMTYIKYKKIIAAHKELTATNAKLSEIAYEYGFKEYSTFYRNYVKIIGYPPKERR